MKKKCARFRKRIYIEHLFASLKSFIKIANRYEKYIDNYKGLIYIFLIYTLYKKVNMDAKTTKYMAV